MCDEKKIEGELYLFNSEECLLEKGYPFVEHARHDADNNHKQNDKPLIVTKFQSLHNNNFAFEILLVFILIVNDNIGIGTEETKIRTVTFSIPNYENFDCYFTSSFYNVYLQEKSLDIIHGIPVHVE